MKVDAHIRVLQEALRSDHEAWIAEIQHWADEAAARGDSEAERRHLAHIARLQELPKPWAQDAPTDDR